MRIRIPAGKLGRIGELWAMFFYLLRGYRVVGWNVRLVRGEIDLVLRRGPTLVVAEVKTRQTRSSGEGFEAVDARKRMRLVRLGDQYMARRRGAGLQLRYDIVSLYWTGWRFVVRHYADAFRPVADARQPWKWTA